MIETNATNIDFDEVDKAISQLEIEMDDRLLASAIYGMRNYLNLSTGFASDELLIILDEISETNNLVNNLVYESKKMLGAAKMIYTSTDTNQALKLGAKVEGN